MIKISNLSNIKTGKSNMFFDLHLDFTPTLASNSNHANNIVAGNDVVIDVDEQAIRNSLVNLLTQRRYLVPDINTNLKKLIGKPVNDMNARVIAENINRIINLYEARVKLNKVLVAAHPDEFLYYIIMYVSLPNFNRTDMLFTATFDNLGNINLVNNI